MNDLLDRNSEHCWICLMTKLRTTLGKFGEFWALIAYFWLAWVKRNHFVNTIFSNLSKEFADHTYDNGSVLVLMHSNQRMIDWILSERVFTALHIGIPVITFQTYGTVLFGIPMPRQDQERELECWPRRLPRCFPSFLECSSQRILLCNFDGADVCREWHGIL